MGCRVRLRGLEGLNEEEVEAELAAGGRLVYYEYCISLIFLTLRRPTEIFFLRPGELGLVRGLPYSLVSLLLGWWGIPWGIIYTPLTLITNFSGGRDVTAQVREWLHHASVGAPEALS
jgi:hypothetical protein